MSVPAVCVRFALETSASAAVVGENRDPNKDPQRGVRVVASQVDMTKTLDLGKFVFSRKFDHDVRTSLGTCIACLL